jgi:thioredoxin-dependent peroxiredoxin
MTRNTPLVDPPKATKGRRMSKKTRKKSPTESAKRGAAKQASVRSPAAAKRPASKTGKPAAASPKKSRAKASQKAASKPLKSATSVSAPKSGLNEGGKAPAFSLPRDGGDTVRLADFAGKKLVVFFYPRADTPGCTKEAIDFTRLKGAFADTGTAVLGVSADPVKAQEAFRSKHQLSVPLISDEQHEMLEAYGAWGEKSMYGRNFMGIIRTTILIGADRRIAKIWRNVRVDGHADDVLATVRAL